MKIELFSHRDFVFAICDTYEQANVAMKAIVKREYWSDVMYDIKFDDGREASGSIDIEPRSFFNGKLNCVFTEHIKTFWTNVSNATVEKYPWLTKEVITEASDNLKSANIPEIINQLKTNNDEQRF